MTSKNQSRDIWYSLHADTEDNRLELKKNAYPDYSEKVDLSQCLMTFLQFKRNK